MIDLREHAHRLLDRADDVVDIGFEQEHRAVVVGFLGQFGDHLAAGLEAFLGLVLRIAHPVGFGVVGAGLRNHVGRAEIAGVADDLLQPLDIGLALLEVGMDDVGVAGNGADRQVVRPERVAHLLGLLLVDLAGAKVDILEMQVELHRVEAVAPDLPGRLFEPVGEIGRENARLHHDGCPPCRSVDREFRKA